MRLDGPEASKFFPSTSTAIVKTGTWTGHRVEGEQLKQQLKQEQQLKRKKERLDLQTELAAANARINVLSTGSRHTSRASDGMSSYFRNPTARFNLHATEFSPHQAQTSIPRQNIQTQQGHVNITPPVINNGNQGDIYNLIQRQNDITAMLAQQHLTSTLPPRDIPVYDGDPLQFEAFIRAFERGVERKTDDESDCLHYLEQYTRGQPKDLVRSCQHLPPAQGYQRAKHLLKEHFGNEHKIATAYMNKAFTWTMIKAEDVKALQAFSLFLRGCRNATEHLTYMDEMNVVSNMKNILQKLPYKLRDKWRNRACQLQEERGHRATFPDLVDFMERQVKILSDPLFGNIQDDKPSTTFKTSTFSKERSRPRVSSFATTVTCPRTPVLEHATINGMKIPPSTTKSLNSCLFCRRSGQSLEQCPHILKKTHRERLDFLKEKGVCFGCLKIGHMSKHCHSRLTCYVCNQNHPEILHIEQKGKRKEAEHTEQHGKPTGGNTVVSPQICGHIGAGDDHPIFSIIPVQVKSHKGDKVLQTYAFLDPGSSSTFCTESLMRRLNLTGQRTNILLKTMNQEKIV